MTKLPNSALAAIDSGRAFIRRARIDLLSLSGADAFDLAHRIAASEIRTLEAGSVQRVIFTDEKGRVVDAPSVWRGDELTLLSGPGRGEALRAWIDRWIIAEDASITVDPEHAIFDLTGEATLRLAAQIAEVELPPPGRLASGEGVVVHLDATEGPVSGHLLVVAQHTDRVAEALSNRCTEVDDRDIAAWCAREGVARPGPGLEAGCHPLELGWKSQVSFTKGCYIGQEVVARLDTYDKVKRHVVAIACDAVPESGAVVRHAGRRVGVVLEGASLDDSACAVAVLDHVLAVGAVLEVENAGAGVLLRTPAP